MFSLLLGPDEFGKKQYIQGLAQQEKAETVLFVEPESLPMGQLGGQDLFAAKKVFALERAIKLIDEKNLSQLIHSKNQILLLEEKIDKRSTFNKSLLANKDIAIKDFQLPHGKELDAWIVARAQALGGTITNAGANALAVALGRDSAKETKFGGRVVEVQEVFSLLDADNELKKLLAYASGKDIDESMVAGLVKPRQEADVLDIVNAIGEHDKNSAYRLMEIFLSSETASEEKTKIIQLNALLSEQFRNVAMVQDFAARKVPEAKILELTEWKSGRLFVMKKIASKFPHQITVDLLGKLSALDEELKTSQTPPKVLLDLIFSQL